MQICFVCHMWLNLQSFFSRHFNWWLSWSVHLTWMALWINETGSESSIVCWIVIVILWMRLRHRFGSISTRGWVQSIINFWNVNLVKSSWSHCGWGCLKVACLKDVSALLSLSLRQQRVCLQVWHITLVLGNHRVFALDRFALHD